MSAALLVSLIGIAVVDSLNPTLFIAQLYLLTTPQPIPRLLSYIAGVMLVNVSGGVVLLAGVQTVIVNFLSNIDVDAQHIGQLVLGLAIFGFGLWLKPTMPRNDEVKKPRSLHPRHTFVLGMVVMLNEITTALPYFVAIERIVQAQLGAIGNSLALIIYNAVFSAPLLAFVALFVAYRQRFAAQLARITHAIQHWTPRFIKYGSLVFGGGLALNSLLFLTTGDPLVG